MGLKRSAWVFAQKPVFAGATTGNALPKISGKSAN
jgi:hypothetical protein